VRFVCAHCGANGERKAGHVNRSLKAGAPLYCNRACAGLARRSKSTPTAAERRANKAAYDREYRARNLERLRAEKAERYQRTRDPVKEREVRKARMPQHVEYCRRPEYRAWKADYDRQRTAAEYGPYAETYRLLLDLEREIRSRATKYERYVARGYFTRSAQERRRELWRALNRKT
jgi:hypothetical protein